MADLYLEYAKTYLHRDQNLDEAFQLKYGVPLDEEIINQQNVKMVIVATSMDSSTERIITYLRNTYLVDINILFFHVFAYEGKRFISRAWFAEDVEESPAPVMSSGKWNGEYYVSLVQVPAAGRMPNSMVLSQAVADSGIARLSKCWNQMTAFG